MKVASSNGNGKVKPSKLACHALAEEALELEADGHGSGFGDEGLRREQRHRLHVGH